MGFDLTLHDLCNKRQSYFDAVLHNLEELIDT